MTATLVGVERIRRHRRANRWNVLVPSLKASAITGLSRLIRAPVVIIQTQLEAKVFRADGPHVWDAKLEDWQRDLLRQSYYTLQGKVWYGPGCTVEDYGVISRRVITDVGVAFFVDAEDNSVEMENMNWHAMGTGATAEAVGDTWDNVGGEGAQVESRVLGTQSQPAANQIRTVATITATAGRAITEHGKLSASTGGVLEDRSVFTVINLANGDSIQFTHTKTYTSGG
jgi:hypothetical protein